MVKGTFKNYKDQHALNLLNEPVPHGPSPLVQIQDPQPRSRRPTHDGGSAKYTIEQVEALELAPGTEHEQLEGWIPELASEEAVRQALEKAFDYRGDVTLTLKGGERVEAYIFNRRTRRHAGGLRALLHPKADNKRKLIR